MSWRRPICLRLSPISSSGPTTACAHRRLPDEKRQGQKSSREPRRNQSQYDGSRTKLQQFRPALFFYGTMVVEYRVCIILLNMGQKDESLIDDTPDEDASEKQRLRRYER